MVEKKQERVMVGKKSCRPLSITVVLRDNLQVLPFQQERPRCYLQVTLELQVSATEEL